MKALKVLILSILLITPLAVLAENSNQTQEGESTGYMKGKYYGFSLGTPGALNFHAGYMGEKAGISFSISPLGLVAPVTFLSNLFIFLESGDWNDKNFLRYFRYFSGQGNFFINILRGNDYIFAASLFAGGVYYSLERNNDKVYMIYGGAAVNWFYKNLFIEVGVAFKHDYTNRTFLKKLPVLPSVQVGYVFRF